MLDFPVVQHNSAVSWGTDISSLPFLSRVSTGNIILVAIGNYGDGTFAINPGFEDSLGNIYVKWGESNWLSANEANLSMLFVSQGNGTTTTGGIRGGLCTIYLTGVFGGNNGGASIIIAELETPEIYEIFGFYHIDNNNDNAAFRASVNDGALGGEGSSDTGSGSIICSPNGAVEEFTNNSACSLLLMNQFLDVTQIFVNFNDYYPLNSGAWTCSGTIIAETYQPPNNEEGGTASDASLVLAFQVFPYLGGSLTAQCGDTPNGTVGIAYGPDGDGSYLLASGGTSPYTFTLIGGGLPPGLSLDSSTGLISGTPTEAGKFIFTVNVEDSLDDIYPITCIISICPAEGSGGSSNYAYYARC